MDALERQHLAPRAGQDVVVSEAVRRSRRVAIVLAPRLGDTLLMLVIAHNVWATGRQVRVFGDYAHALADWFPELSIAPSLAADQAPAILSDFDLAIQMHVGWPWDLCQAHPQALCYDHIVQVTGRGFVKLQQIVLFCRYFLGIDRASADNGLRARDRRQWRRYPRRVVIHPTSSGTQRCWAPAHFRELGLALRAAGFEPSFIVAPAERPDWLWVQDLGLDLPQLPSLSAVAGHIHQSGWFIGNESGIGHLSSNLGVPTLSLTGRPTRTRCWLPSWSPAAFVYPKWLIGGRLRDRYWRTALSCPRVMAAFERFRQATEPALHPPDYLWLTPASTPPAPRVESVIIQASDRV